MSMRFTWTDYSAENAPMVDGWLDAEAVAMTGLDQGWDRYWNAVLADAAAYPGCKDQCKLVCENGIPVAAICFGCYGGVATVSEILVAPQLRGKGYGSRILRELVVHVEELLGETAQKICAVIFPDNLASQRAFTQAGFVFDHAKKDEAGISWNYVYSLD